MAAQSATTFPMRLSRNEAQARTTIAQRATKLTLQLGTTTWQARLVPTCAPATTSAPSVLLHIEWAGAPFVLQLPAAAIEQVIAAGLGQAGLPDVPHDLAQVVLEASLADVLQALQSLGRGTPQLAHWTQSDSPEAHSEALPLHAFNLQLRANPGPEAISGTLHTDGLGLLLVAGLVARHPPAPGPLQDDVPLALPIELGSTRLTLEELDSLGPGDVVLMDTCLISEQRTLWLTADGQAGVRLELALPLSEATNSTPHCLTVLHPWTETMLTSSPDEVLSTTVATTLDALPVRLSFDLGELTLTLAQLRALQPGQTLGLGRPLAGTVCIRANGALVGEGDLVEIDGQIGVSVHTLFGNCATR